MTSTDPTDPTLSAPEPPAPALTRQAEPPRMGRRRLAGAAASFGAAAGALATLGLAMMWASPAPVRVAGGIPVVRSGPTVATPETRPVMEVVFVLDTTGSMAGLIRGAQSKIWELANQLASGQPRPQLSIGLVAYRDRGDAYVTQVSGLSEDLEQVYVDLMKLTADGGGDTPEDVVAGLAMAVDGMRWSPNAMKTIFLVGDAPAQRYADAPSLESVLALARAKGIRVHAMQAGAMAETTPVWRQIAALGAGSFTLIPQDGGTVAIATPYDAELARLSGSLDATVMAFGGAAERGRVASKMAVAKPESSAASRASFYAKKKEFRLDDNDLTNAEVDVDKFGADDLPAELAVLAPAARKAKVDEMRSKRGAIMKQIESATRARDAYLRDKAKDAPKSALDDGIKGALKEQAAGYGIKY